MRFQWNGSTWTTGADDSPTEPIGFGYDTEGQIQRNFNGTARNHHRFDKARISLRWDQIGTNLPETRIKDMLVTAGTVEIAWSRGTYSTYPVPGSLTAPETGYSIYDISAQFVEV